jgi:hypothetical protein
VRKRIDEVMKEHADGTFRIDAQHFDFFDNVAIPQAGLGNRLTAAT